MCLALQRLDVPGWGDTCSEEKGRGDGRRIKGEVTGSGAVIGK